MVVRKEGPAEGLFGKETAPPPSEIKNSTAPPSAPGNLIEAVVSNTSNWAEDIDLVRNKGLEVDDGTGAAPDNVPLVETNAADTLFERHKWGWDGIDCRAMVAQNQNEPSFKNGRIPQSFSYIDIFLHYLPFKWFRIVFLQSMPRAMKEADITPLTLVDLLRYLGLWLLMPNCSGWKREMFWRVTPFDQKANPCLYRLG